MSHFGIAGIQMQIGMTNNIPHLRNRIDILMHLYPWVEMVVLSELASYGPDLRSAESRGGSVEREFAEVARKHRIWVVPGSYFERADGRIYNTTPVIDPRGEVVTRYRKMFPFTPFEHGTTPGSEFCVFDVPDVGRFGVSICYDLWFPELTRTLVSMGAEVIINPVLADFVDRPADLSIAQASAAMFQTYIFHINGLAVGGDGRSRVIDPAGQILHEGGRQDQMIPIEIDFGLVRRQRQRGLLNMGQPLKSFRDCTTEFDVYGRQFDRTYLDSLGRLEKPERANPVTTETTTDAA